MDWYYTSNEGAQTGPVSEAEFNAFVKSGAIHADTLVWRDGFPQWVKYSEASQAAAATSRCSECGNTFAHGDMVNFSGNWVCANCKPLYVQKIREGVPTGGDDVWRYKKTAVARLNAAFPKRCVKCNEPCDEPQIKRKVRWNPPTAFLLGGALLALLFTKRSTVLISVCPRHRAVRKNAIITGWILALAGLGGIFGGASMGSDTGGMVILAGVALFFVGVIWGAAKGKFVSPTKMTKEYMWLGGCKRPFLESLSEWTGPNK